MLTHRLPGDYKYDGIMRLSNGDGSLKGKIGSFTLISHVLRFPSFEEYACNSFAGQWIFPGGMGAFTGTGICHDLLLTSLMTYLQEVMSLQTRPHIS